MKTAEAASCSLGSRSLQAQGGGLERSLPQGDVSVAKSFSPGSTLLAL